MSRTEPVAPPTVVRHRRSFGRDFRLVLATAGFTSLFWIVLLAFTGSDLFTITKVRSEGSQPVASKSVPEASGLETQFVERAASSGGVRPTMVDLPTGALLIPVDGVAFDALIDTFDQPRGERRHEALDIVAPMGTPVVSASNGMVEKLFLSDEGGKTIYVRSNDGGRMFYYAHLDAYAPGLTEGDIVKPGQKIGTVGISGNADPATPHLHFSILRMAPDDPWWKGTPENPYDLLTAARAN